MKKISFIFLLSISTLSLTSCAQLVGDKAKDEAFKVANNKAKSMGLKVGSACKYIGFIGDNSESKAVADGKIKFKMFSVQTGGLLKNCTYAYGK